MPGIRLLSAAAAALVALAMLFANAANATTGGGVAIDSSGGILVAGSANNSFAIVRYLPDGSLDRSFGHRGKVTTSFGHRCTAGANDIAIDGAGRIVLAGSSQCIANVYAKNVERRARTRFALARYRPDGALDRSFGHHGRVTTAFPGSMFGQPPRALSARAGASAVAVTPAGGIVAAGTTLHMDLYERGEPGDAAFALAAYKPNGSLDQSFGAGGKVVTPFAGNNGIARDIAVDGAGNVLAAGGLCTCSDLGILPSNNTVNSALARYTPNGALDVSFGSAGKEVGPGSGFGNGAGVAVDPSGNVVVANGNNVLRFTPTGALDKTFGSDGVVTLNILANDVALDSSNRIVLAGLGPLSLTSLPVDFAVERLSPDGSVDTSFGSGGTVMSDLGHGKTDEANEVALTPSGEIIAAGSIAGGSNGFDVPIPGGRAIALARYTPAGALDPTFSGNGFLTTRFRPNTWVDGVYINRRTVFFNYTAGTLLSSLHARFQCVLRSRKEDHTHFTRCSSRGQRYKGLSPGRYTFDVRAMLPSGPDPTPAKWRFKVRKRGT